MAAIQGGARCALPIPSKAPHKRPWTLFFEAMGAIFAGLGGLRQPAGAVALIALGFFASRWAHDFFHRLGDVAPSDDVFATVRSVRSDPAGRVQIAFDEPRRTLSGSRTTSDQRPPPTGDDSEACSVALRASCARPA